MPPVCRALLHGCAPTGAESAPNPSQAVAGRRRLNWRPREPPSGTPLAPTQRGRNWRAVEPPNGTPRAGAARAQLASARTAKWRPSNPPSEGATGAQPNRQMAPPRTHPARAQLASARTAKWHPLAPAQRGRNWRAIEPPSGTPSNPRGTLPLDRAPAAPPRRWPRNAVARIAAIGARKNRQVTGWRPRAHATWRTHQTPMREPGDPTRPAPRPAAATRIQTEQSAGTS